ncbi:hypothetical protein VNO77_00265 [Canavalia gladiata]|uniref:Uncharacterized protein n=1 Tax=Canavalia gladiata TaxID=3824 RepID=A0AAN9R946_CANGL
MASSKVFCRLSSRLQALSHSHNKFTKPSLSLHINPQSASARRLSRLPVALGSWESMMPLHSAVASSRLVSSLSIESLGWGLVPQVSCCKVAFPFDGRLMLMFSFVLRSSSFSLEFDVYAKAPSMFLGVALERSGFGPCLLG